MKDKDIDNVENKEIVDNTMEYRPLIAGEPISREAASTESIDDTVINGNVSKSARKAAEAADKAAHERPARKMITRRGILRVLGVLAAFLAFIAIALSPVFVLKHVNVHGNSYLPDEEIVRISGINLGENLFQLATDEIMQTMSKDIRIEQAIVRRKFPDSLDIQVVERIPLAIIKCDYGYLEVGRGGIVLDAHRTLAQIPVPIVSGVEVSNLFVGDTVENEQLNKVLNFLDKLNHDTAISIAEINITDPNNVIVYMNHSVQLKMGALDSLQRKLEITESVNREVKQAKHPIEYVDARFDGSYSIKLKE
ncbi:Cell division protein FtsQ [Anaerovibrio sp. JC8]|uniref:cell division protein FtsQ/DivIB n=1 Tax=Anaerovibrio sp. JC8 TaxID=1240085 RepID=UPI000A0A0318|nr:FtsQ-type POTRA domain-containing protein [Anaerovibrio sp. JC8]ORU01347.1 Cell division protein FtsQ [Anaerovibrio sp. JC8]